MSWLKRIFDFYINASIHVAFAVVALYLVTVFHLQSSTNMDLALFLGLGTIACYNFIKYGVEAEKYLIVSNPAHKTIQVISIISLFGALFFFFRLPRSLWGILAILGFLSMLYAIPFLPKAKNLRSLGGMKVFLVALVWAGCTALLPLLENGKLIHPAHSILVVQRFLLVLLLLIPFEIRDLKYDAAALKTFPQRLGVPKTKWVGYGLLLLYVLLELLESNHSRAAILPTLILVLLLFFAIKHASVDAPKYYASFWVEGIPMLYFGLSVLLGKGFI